MNLSSSEFVNYDANDEYLAAQEDDDLDRKQTGIFRPPFLLDDPGRSFDWTYGLRSLTDPRMAWFSGKAPDDYFFFFGWPTAKRVPKAGEPYPWSPLFPEKTFRHLRRKSSNRKRAQRFLLYWYIADSHRKFPLEPPWPEEVYEDEVAGNYSAQQQNVLRIHYDLQRFQDNIPTFHQQLFKNGLVEKARRFYMPVQLGGSTPMVPPPTPTPEEQQEKGYKGIPFLKAEDIPISALSPNAVNLWTRIREQFNDALYRRDWRPPASMAWDPQMLYSIPFWREPRLRRPTGAARTWRWRHQWEDEPGARSLFYGSALFSPLDRAMAGSDRLDPPGWSRLDDPERMLFGHRREVRKENAAALRYLRTMFQDEYERKAEEIWSRGTIAGDKGPVHYDRSPRYRRQKKGSRRWLGLIVLAFLLYLMWVTGTASDKYLAEQNWYQHPIVHDRARFHGFRVREMKVNGNGFWHALADQLYGTPEVWQWVRQAYFFSWSDDTFELLSSAPIGDVNDGTTLLDFYEFSSLADTNWVKMWVRNLPGDFDEEYKNMEWTGRPGQTMSYYDMSPDYVHMRRDLVRDKKDMLPPVYIPGARTAEEVDGDEISGEGDDEMEYAEALDMVYHPMDHIDMFYVASVMGIRINILSTAYSIPHSKAWIHIDPAWGEPPKYEVNLLMHYVNGEIIGFDSLVPYDQKEWHGVAMDTEKIGRRREREDQPGRMTAERMSYWEDYVRQQMEAGMMEEAQLASAVSLV